MNHNFMDNTKIASIGFYIRSHCFFELNKHGSKVILKFSKQNLQTSQKTWQRRAVAISENLLFRRRSHWSARLRHQTDIGHAPRKIKKGKNAYDN